MDGSVNLPDMGDLPAPGRPATYDDLLALPDNVVGEIVGGKLHVSPRPAPRHAVASSALGGHLGPPFQRGQGGPGGSKPRQTGFAKCCRLEPRGSTGMGSSTSMPVRVSLTPGSSTHLRARSRFCSSSTDAGSSSLCSLATTTPASRHSRTSRSRSPASGRIRSSPEHYVGRAELERAIHLRTSGPPTAD